MTIKSKVLAAAATLTLVASAGLAGALTPGISWAATPSCGISCVDVFSQQLGTHHDPGYVLDVFRQGEKAGQPIILFRTANFDPAEDFTVSFQGTVADFYAAGLVSASLDLHYSHFAAFEFQYSPHGVDSGLCAGVASTAANGTPVVLVPCGSTAKSVWVVDSYDTITGHYVPLINGSDTNFSHPYVLTYPARSFPADHPRAQLYTTNLTGSTVNNDGGPALTGVTSNQLWSWDYGPLH